MRQIGLYLKMNDKRDMDGPVDKVGHEDCQVVSVKLKRKRKMKLESFDKRKPKCTKPESDDSQPVEEDEKNTTDSTVYNYIKMNGMKDNDNITINNSDIKTKIECDDIKTDFVKHNGSIVKEYDIKTDPMKWDHDYALHAYSATHCTSDAVVKNESLGFLKSEPYLSDAIKLDTSEFSASESGRDTLKHGLKEDVDYNLDDTKTEVISSPEVDLNSPVNVAQYITLPGAMSLDDTFSEVCINTGRKAPIIHPSSFSKVEKASGVSHEQPRQFVYFCALCRKKYRNMQSLTNHSCNDSTEPTLNILKDGVNCKRVQDGVGADDGTVSTEVSLPYSNERQVRLPKFPVRLTIDLTTFSNSIKFYTCSICDQGFQLKRNLLKHSNIHSNGKRQACLLCEKTFDDVANLQTHMLIHRGTPKYPVPQCLRRYVKVDAQSSKPYVCVFCGSTFGLIKNVAEHVLRHKNGHSCMTCGKENLKRDVCNCQTPYASSDPKSDIDSNQDQNHQIMYANFRPTGPTSKSARFLSLLETANAQVTEPLTVLICGLCSGSFHDELELDDHFAAHAEKLGRPARHFCDDCGKSFTREIHLKHHRRVRRHDSKCNPIHICKLCGMTFRSWSRIAEHFMTFHKSVSEAPESSLESYIHTIPGNRICTSVGPSANGDAEAVVSDNSNNYCERNLSSAACSDSNVLTITPSIDEDNSVFRANNPVLDVGNPVLKVDNPVPSVLKIENPVLDEGNSVLTVGNPVLDVGNPVLDEGNSVLTVVNPVLDVVNSVLNFEKPDLKVENPVHKSVK